MNYGFIGAGNMAGAIIKGMTIGTGSFEGKDIYVYDLSLRLPKIFQRPAVSTNAIHQLMLWLPLTFWYWQLNPMSLKML